MESTRIHFIGICGVAMGGLAMAFKKKGYTVTGSDVGFYPPISTYLKDNGIEYYAGWHPEKIGKPDLVVVGNVASSTNPEWLYVQEQKLEYKSYPEVIKEFFVKENSIVCAGTYGKTTSTALLTWILKEAGMDPSYMFGGLMASPSYQEGVRGSSPVRETGVTFGQKTATLPSPLLGREGNETLPLPSAAIADSNLSVLEGDEYKASRWDNGPKFAYYSPTHLLLTSVVWDHADVYPTEEKYIETFRRLVAGLPKNGLLVISEQAKSVISNPSIASGEKSSVATSELDSSSAFGLARNDSTVVYGPSETSDYSYSDIVQTKDGIAFIITDNLPAQKGLSPIAYRLSTSCFGEYMADNIAGCFAMATKLGVKPEDIISGIKSFPGMKRRLEKRYEGNVTVFDDIAHSATKAKSVLETLRKIYTGKVIAVFEPNTGNRRPQAKAWYDHAFKDADEVIIPRLTKIKIDASEEAPMEGDELTNIISKTHHNTLYIDDDAKLIEHITTTAQPGDVVVFLGSHGFRGMIEDLIKNF